MTPWLQDLLGAGVVISASVLLLAGLGKARDRRTFASQIAAYEIIPTPASRVLGQVLPFAEIAAALALLTDPRLGGVVAALLFAAFAVALTINLVRGRSELVCGCFGPRGRHTISSWHVAGNGFLAAVSVAAVVTPVRLTVPGAVLGGSVILIVAVAQAVLQVHVPARQLIPRGE